MASGDATYFEFDDQRRSVTPVRALAPAPPAHASVPTSAPAPVHADIHGPQVVPA
jgi:hypothetical protein